MGVSNGSKSRIWGWYQKPSRKYTPSVYTPIEVPGYSKKPRSMGWVLYIFHPKRFSFITCTSRRLRSSRSEHSAAFCALYIFHPKRFSFITRTSRRLRSWRQVHSKALEEPYRMNTLDRPYAGSQNTACRRLGRPQNAFTNRGLRKRLGMGGIRHSTLFRFAT